MYDKTLDLNLERYNKIFRSYYEYEQATVGGLEQPTADLGTTLTKIAAELTCTYEKVVQTQ